MRLSALVGALVCCTTLDARAVCDTRVGSPVEDGIRSRGAIRIGTTGDYAPFSFVRGGERRGIDIDLGERLARDLGVRLVWVATSWPALVADLDAGRFDVVMSGVTVTDERRAHGCFTDEYVITGKTVLAPCDRAARFTSLEAIDRPGVRVIVNPGGTNARFVDSHITRATIVRHADNVSIFAALATGGADVMITDALEATRIADEDPRLCAPLPETYFERVPKAFYLPADTAWHGRLDAWLDARRADGTLAHVLKTHRVAVTRAGQPHRSATHAASY
jgi:ABC-type amino acid transport substrate-binding protein